MKKGKFLILGLIALMLAGGLALASCKQDCSDGCGRSVSACSKDCFGGSQGGPSSSPCSSDVCK